MSVALVCGGLLLCAAAAQAAPLSPLGHEGRWITDAKGRVVILHGANMVYKRPPYAPDAVGFGRDDASFLARNGFNYVRLGLIWKALEPAPGVYDDGYLDRIGRTARVLSRHGIHVLLDFHQDLYNERYQGEGAPEWAIVGRAAGEGPGAQAGFPANYLLNEPLNHLFDAFWANTEVPGTGRGVQDYYAGAWRHVARRFRGMRGIVGYNLFNEPWGGSVVRNCALTTPPVTPGGNCAPASELERRALTAFHKRVIGAIRQVDRRTLAWYAPYLTFDFGLRTSHGDTGDRRAGFAFNAYCGQADPVTAAALPFAAGKPCSYTAELSFDNADAHSRRTGDALLDTELGASDAAKNWIPYIAAADRHMVGWAYWAYCGCSDPTGSIPPELEALVLDPAQRPAGREPQAGQAEAAGAGVPGGRIWNASLVQVQAGEPSVHAALLDQAGREPLALQGRLDHRDRGPAHPVPARLPRAGGRGARRVATPCSGPAARGMRRRENGRRAGQPRPDAAQLTRLRPLGRPRSFRRR